MTVALHHLSQVLSATVLIPINNAAKALRTVQGALDAEPHDLSITPAVSTGPDGRRALMLFVLWSGSEARGERVVEDLLAECGGNVLTRRWSSYRDSFDPAAEAAWPKQSNYHIRTRNLRRLDDEAIEVLVDDARRMPGAMDALFLHDFHGAPTRVPVGATAFSARHDHYAVEVVGHWQRDEPGNDHIAWVEALTERLSTVALPGGYPNLLGPDETERVRDYYGAAAERLLAIKRRVDPQNLLRSAIGRLA